MIRVRSREVCPRELLQQLLYLVHWWLEGLVCKLWGVQATSPKVLRLLVQKLLELVEMVVDLRLERCTGERMGSSTVLVLLS